MMRNVFRISGLLLALLLTQQASAHAHLKSQYTAVNPAGSAWPESLTISFTEDIEPAFSAVTVSRLDKKPLEQLKAERDPKQLNTLHVQFKQRLTPGEYGVDWHVLSVDGHKTKGHYTFSVQ